MTLSSSDGIDKMFVKISLVCATSRWRHSTCTSILMGVIVGIALSLVVFPLIDEECLLKEDLGSDRFNGRIRSLPDSSVDTDDYEPRVILEGLKTKSPSAVKTPIRPRFYSTELNVREKLFVAVISHTDTVATLAVALNNTMAHHVAKLVIFVQSRKKKNPKKSFAANQANSNAVVYLTSDVSSSQFPLDVLRYVGMKFARDYDFYFVVDDTTYVRALKLVSLVGHISVSRHVYMGAPVLRNNNDRSGDDFDTAIHSQFCDYGSGILFSNSLLRAVHRNVEHCLHDQDTSEDSSKQIGRCVQRSSSGLYGVAISCQSRVQGEIFAACSSTKRLLNFGENESKTLEDYSELNDAITVSPVTTAEQCYRLHLHFSGVDLLDTKARISAVRAEIEATDTLYTSEGHMSWPIGIAPKYEGQDRFSVISWDYLNASVVYPESDFSAARNMTTAELEQLDKVLNNAVTQARKGDGRNLRFERVVNAYRRYDPTRGLDYLLDIEFLDLNSGLKVEKRMEAVYPLGKVEIIPVPYVTENTRLVLVLQVTIVEQESTRRFLAEFTEVGLEKLDNSILVLVFIYDHTDRLDPNDIHRPIKNVVMALNDKYHAEGAKLSWINVKTTDSLPSEFGVLDLVSKKYPPNTLFLVCQPGSEIHADYLNRVRMNTIAGHQVFFPIPFVQFHPGIVFRPGGLGPAHPPNKIEIHKQQGHFASHSFDHYSFYNSDYQTSRRLIEHEVPMARNDRDLTRDARHRAKTGHDVYSAFLRSKSVHVMRAVEPSLRVRFRAGACQSELSVGSHDQCVVDWLEGLAGRADLASALLEYGSSTRRT